MDAVHLSRLTTTLTIVVVGLAGGHTLLPYAAGGAPAPLARRLAFWGLLLAAGAVRGWRDASARDETGRRAGLRVALTALAAAAAGLAAYWAFHGALRGI